MSMRTVVLAELAPVEAYSLLATLVVPRPIALVSSLAADGVANLAPFSFFMLGGANPPSLVISPTLSSKGIEKDTLRNIRETGEYVINLVHREIAVGMNEASAPLPPEESEWERAGLTPIPSAQVRPARVEESSVQFECRLFQIVEHGEGPNAARYIIGEVLVAHVAENVVPPVARLGGKGYLDLADGSTFELGRPNA